MNAFFLLLGAVLGLYLGHGPGWGRLILCLLASLLGLAWAKKRQGLRYYLPALGAGVAVGLLAFFWPDTAGKTTQEGFVIKVADNYLVLLSGMKRYYVSIKNHSYEVGDYLNVQGTKTLFTAATYESRFDFGAYLSEQGVRYELANVRHTALFRTPFRLKAWQDSFLSHYEAHAQAYLRALLFGKKDYSSELVEHASSLNLLFILSSSGMLYGWLLRTFCYFVGLWKQKQAEWITLLFGLIFLPFGFHKVGILRVYAMRLVGFLDRRFLKKDLDFLSRWGIAGLSILALDFHHVFNTGFLLGFGISLLMYVASPMLKSRRAIMEKGKGLFLLRLFLLPMGLSSGQGIHFFGAIFTLVLTPVSILTMCLGYLSLFSFPFPHVLNPLGEVVYAVLTWLEKVDFMLPFPVPSLLFLGTYYTVYGLCLFLQEMQAKRWRNILVFSFIGAYAIGLLPIVPVFSQSVRFINVGQGDCCLIQDGLSTVMIDTGGVTSFDMAQEALIPYLRKERIYRIDVVIATHQDYDHMGAVASLMQHYEVGRYVKDKEDFPLDVGRIHLENYNVYEADEENDKSLVMGLTFMGKKWLFTGDAPIWVERAILRDNPGLDCDILKVGHHGSDTSTCAEWLDQITPETAIISCGRKNKFGHPKPSVLALLQARKIEIRRTDLEGTIVYRAPRPF